jgi:hypothetical protein
MAIALGAKTEIGADLWQADLAIRYHRAQRCAHRRSRHPPIPCNPDVAVLVAADAIGEARLAVERHLSEGFAILELVAIPSYPDDAFGVGACDFPVSAM